MRGATFEEKLELGEETASSVARYLNGARGARVMPADRTVSGAAFRDAHGLPVPDLLKITSGMEPQYVEVKSKAEWYQRGGNHGPLETFMEDRHLQAYERVGINDGIPVVLIFVIRGHLNAGYLERQLHRLGVVKPPRGHAGCYYAKIVDLKAWAATAPKRKAGGQSGFALLRQCDGGPLRPLAPWDEATKSIPLDEASWAAWRAIEPGTAKPLAPLTCQTVPQCG